MVDRRDLVERAKRGDHDAFEALAGPLVSRLDAAARLILRDPELARDAVQDGFIRAWRNMPALRDPDRFDAWLRRLVVNSCLDITRRRRRRPMEIVLSPLDAAYGRDMAVAIADRDLLDGALRHLDPEWRAIVVLHYFLGMPLPDVAASLGIPLGTAKSRLHRSLAVMRTAIATEEAQPNASLLEGRPA
jgi:RNA polymerase sigma-70 factor, ECF subfamily